MTRLAGCENYGPSVTGAQCMFTFTEYLVNTIGWTITAQSDGSGNPITGGGSGAGGYANTSAYRELQDPGGIRRVSWQRGADNTLWRAKVMEVGGSSGGTATTTPVAVGSSGLIFGGGTDASPTYTQMLPADSSYMFHAVADDAPIAGSNVYPFWFGTNQTGTTSCYSVFICDGLQAGSYHPSDASPMLVYGKYQAGSFYCFPPYSYWPGGPPAVWNDTTGGFSRCFMGPSMTPTTFVGSAGGSNSWGLVFSGTSNQLGPWPFGAQDGGINFEVGRTQSMGGVTGLKGRTATWLLSFRGGERFVGDSVNLSTSDAYVHFGTASGAGGIICLLPWVQTVAMALS